MDYWYNEGLEAAWGEFMPGDPMPSIEELMANVKDSCDIESDDDALSFAQGWLERARQIQAKADDGPCPLRAWYDTSDELK